MEVEVGRIEFFPCVSCDFFAFLVGINYSALFDYEDYVRRLSARCLNFASLSFKAFSVFLEAERSLAVLNTNC